MGADLQILDAKRKCIGEAYFWLSPATVAGYVPEGMGAWINGFGELAETETLLPGEGVQITLPSDSDITVLCPIEL